MHPQGRARWCCIACKRPQPLRPTLGWPRPWRSLLRCRCPRAQGCLRWPSSRLTTDVCSAPPAVAAARHCEPDVWTGARLETGAEAGEEACNLGCGTGWMSHRRGPHGPSAGSAQWNSLPLQRAAYHLQAAPASHNNNTCFHSGARRTKICRERHREATENTGWSPTQCTAGCGTAWLPELSQHPCSQALTLVEHD